MGYANYAGYGLKLIEMQNLCDFKYVILLILKLERM